MPASRRRRHLSLVTLAVAAALSTTLGATLPAGASGAAAYQVVGNQVVGPNGQQFVPYGFVVYCLARPGATCNTPGSMSDPAKIQAAATFWHANVVRIQVAAENLLTNGSVNPTVMQELIDEVQLANDDGMVAIITDQEAYFGGDHLPTAQTVDFWNAVASQFAGDPRVFFDFYNEPNLAGFTVEGGKGAWALWQSGGTDTTSSGVAYQFVGMQTLLDDVRADGAQNVAIAEGLAGDKSLSGIPEFALTGTNVVYGMEPDLTSKDSAPAQWAANWGTLSATVPIFMEAFQDWPGAGTCNPQSPTLLPELLSYLRSNHLGLIVWALDPGVLVVGSHLGTPTSYQGATTQVCWAAGTGGPMLAANTNGPGQLIQSFFLANSQAASATGPGPVTLARAVGRVTTRHPGQAPVRTDVRRPDLRRPLAHWSFRPEVTLVAP